MRLAVFLYAASAFAASPFDGTWRLDLKSARLPQKPSKYLITSGLYSCFSCVPPISDLKADGRINRYPATTLTIIRVFGL